MLTDVQVPTAGLSTWSSASIDHTSRGPIVGFGPTLKKLRMERGWRQEDLVAALGHQFARSTLANVETGRERPSSRLWIHISEQIPEWVAPLEAEYETARAHVGESRAARRSTPRTLLPSTQTAGPFQLESLQLVYTFRYSRTPEEIVEVRRVKALRSGARGYGLKFTARRSGDFSVDEEALWGGSIVAKEFVSSGEDVHYVRTFDFGRSLRRGQTHDFAVRSWVERDPDPDTDIVFSVTVPTARAVIHANFSGPEKPRAVWGFRPRPDGSSTSAEEHGVRLGLSETGAVRFEVTDPVPGRRYGMAWRW